MLLERVRPDAKLDLSDLLSTQRNDEGMTNHWLMRVGIDGPGDLYARARQSLIVLGNWSLTTKDRSKPHCRGYNSWEQGVR